MDQKFDISVSELELKYNADDVKYSEFLKFAEELKPIRRLEIASWDIYYSGNRYKLPFEFLRFRQGDPAQLTIKIKEDEKNNQNRFELDIDILGSVKGYMVDMFAKLIGFEENFRIYKDCMIFWYDKVDIVYYITYDKNKKEKGRFIEIEADKTATFASKEEAWTYVKEMEQKMAAIGLAPANRLKRSMWEMFKKD